MGSTLDSLGHHRRAGDCLGRRRGGRRQQQRRLLLRAAVPDALVHVVGPQRARLLAQRAGRAPHPGAEVAHAAAYKHSATQEPTIIRSCPCKKTLQHNKPDSIDCPHREPLAKHACRQGQEVLQQNL